jgi:hypothetical protein
MSKNKKRAFQFRVNAFKNWFQFKKRLFHLWWANAPKSQVNLEKGNYYIRLGAVAQVGQPIHIHNTAGKVVRSRYIDNLYFNFKENKITVLYANNPVKGYSEQFLKTK